MTAPTHITFAEFVYLLLLTTLGVRLNILNVAIVAVSSLLPDIDTTYSPLGRVVPFVSRWLERRIGHRTLTHSALLISGLALILIPLYEFNRDIYICFMTGLASHPFLDTMTVNGVRLFSPFTRVKCVFPLEVNKPHRFRIQTGGKMDRTLAFIFLAGCVPTFFVAYEGYGRFIRITQQNIEAAVRDYGDFSRGALVLATFSSYNMLTKEPLAGTFEIAGALNPHTLVFKGPDRMLHTLGKDFQADYVAENIRCRRGARVRNVVSTLDLESRYLSDIAAQMDTSAENYLFGELSTEDNVSLPENIRVFTPVTGSGSILRFNHARYDDIISYGLEYVFISKGLLTIKSVIRQESAVIPGGESEDSSVKSVSEDQLACKPGAFSENRRFQSAHFSITVETKESVDFLKRKGDTVASGELIARKNLSRPFQEQIGLNKDKIVAIENKKAAYLSDYYGKMSSARKSAESDSAVYVQDQELHRRAYVGDKALHASALKLEKDKIYFAKLISSKLSTLEKMNIEIRKLKISNQELEAKAKSATLLSEIRSPGSGIIEDIRPLEHKNKREVIFLVKRLR